MQSGVILTVVMQQVTDCQTMTDKKTNLPRSITQGQTGKLITSIDDIVSVMVIRRRRRRRLQHRRLLWCKPWLQATDSDRGMSHFINYELKDDASSFFGLLRMPPEVFRELLDVVAPRITKRNTFVRASICAENMLTEFAIWHQV